MTRYECEEKLLELAKQMLDVYSAYGTAHDLLSVTITDGFIGIYDSFHTADHRTVMDANDNVFSTVDVDSINGETHHNRSRRVRPRCE